MRYLILITVMMLSFSLSAQRGGERGKRGEKIEQQRIAYITTELDLTVNEAQNFWPLYNEYQEAKKEIRDDKMHEKKVEDMTKAESREMLTYALESKKRKLDLEIQFINKLENVISANKRLKLIHLEKEFKKKVLKRFQKRIKRDEKRYKKMEMKKDRIENREEEK